MKWLKRLTALLIVFFLAPSVEAHQLPFKAIETAAPADRGISRLEIGLTFDSYPTADDYTVLAKLAHGALNNLEVELEMPYLFIERGRTADERGQNGFSDIRLRSKVRFLKGREASPLSLAGQVTSKIPSGAKNRGLGTGGPDIGFLAIATKELFPATLHLNVGYTFVGNPANLEGRKPQENSMGYALGLEFQAVWEHVRFLAEAAGQSHNPRDPDRGPSLELLGGASYEAQERLVLSGAFGVGARSSAAGSPNQTITLGLTYGF